jgi:hypothetical protein
MITEIPERCIHKFTSKDDWLVAVHAAGGWFFETPAECGQPEGTLTAATDAGVFGIMYPDGNGHIIDLNGALN